MSDKSTITPDRARIIVKGSSMKLYTNNVDGKPWVCDSYWASPATPVLSAMLTKYGHDLEPRSYSVDSKVTANESTPPEIAKIVPEGFDKVETSAGWVLADFAHLPGVSGRLFTKDGQVIMEAGGKVFGVNVDFLSILTGRVDPFTTYDADNRRKCDVAIYCQVGDPARKPLVVLSTHNLAISAVSGPDRSVVTVDNRAVLMPVKVA